MTSTMRETSWADTGLGPRGSWPASLRTTADICLTSRFPMVVFWGPELTMLYNDAYAPMLGEKHPWALGRPSREVWPEVWDTIGPMLQRVVHKGEATWSNDEPMLLRRHGYLEECYFTFSFSPIRDEDGSAAGVFTAVTETTDRVLKDRRLRTLGALAEHTRDAEEADLAALGAMRALEPLSEDIPEAALYLADDDGATARLVASHGADATAMRATVPVAAAPSWLRRALGGERVVVDLTAGDPGLPRRDTADDGTASSHTAAVLPLLEPATNAVLGVLAIGLSPHRPFDDDYDDFLSLVADQTARGIVDARSIDAERQRADALTELNEAKSRFFSNVSHEFRTPLTLLQAPLAEVLEDDEHPLHDEQRERLLMVQRNAERMGKLVTTLLDLSRLESGRIEASYRATDLSTLTSELASMFPSATERLGLGYEVDIHELPQEVHVDREMWEKIVYNLLSNAIKFTFEGTIRVQLRDAGDHAQLLVHDTGVGIPADEIPHLFERFHRVRDTRARSQEGTGIGLTLVRELVALHGGRIDVDTELERGTTFSIAIPYGTDHLPAEQIDAEPALEGTAVAVDTYLDEVTGWSDEQAAERGQRAAADSSAGGRILVVDDNADMRTYLERVLAEHWHVETVADGEVALQRAREQRPDLVLSDVMMPGLDGFALLEALRGDPELEDVPVVLLSARASEGAQLQGLDGGADDYLIKPFTVDELLARVRSNLHLARQRTQTADLRARQAMLSGLSHEMQTPLAAILGSTSIIEQSPVPDDVEPAVTILRRQAGQLRGLVQRFLDFSRFEAGREPALQLGACAPATLIDNAVEVCGNDRLEVTGELDRLPDVLVDADRVEAILTNLCTNALKFSTDDLPVVIGGRADDGTVVIEVRDHGVGIPADESDRIFDRFFRGRSGDAADGTGLGLYVSRALAEAMGGSLALRRDDGAPGSVFELTVPTA